MNSKQKKQWNSITNSDSSGLLLLWPVTHCWVCYRLHQTAEIRDNMKKSFCHVLLQRCFLSKELTHENLHDIQRCCVFFFKPGRFATGLRSVGHTGLTWKTSLAHLRQRLCWQGRMTTGLENISRHTGQISCFSRLSMVTPPPEPGPAVKFIAPGVGGWKYKQRRREASRIFQLSRLERFTVLD